MQLYVLLYLPTRPYTDVCLYTCPATQNGVGGGGGNGDGDGNGGGGGGGGGEKWIFLP